MCDIRADRPVSLSCKGNMQTALSGPQTRVGRVASPRDNNGKVALTANYPAFRESKAEGAPANGAPCRSQSEKPPSTASAWPVTCGAQAR
ncbi:hypothetical protein PDE01_14480 [Paracoccus denitrificans]|nr:hypothetical protein PDE01_14480 [Paracoccus denitrificans]